MPHHVRPPLTAVRLSSARRQAPTPTQKQSKKKLKKNSYRYSCADRMRHERGRSWNSGLGMGMQNEGGKTDEARNARSDIASRSRIRRSSVQLPRTVSSFPPSDVNPISYAYSQRQYTTPTYNTAQNIHNAHPHMTMTRTPRNDKNRTKPARFRACPHRTAQMENGNGIKWGGHAHVHMDGKDGQGMWKVGAVVRVRQCSGK